MTFGELTDDALRALNYSTSGPSEPRTRVQGYINTWHRRLLTRPGFTRLLRDAERTFDSVTSQPVYGLTYPMGRINGIHERANDISLIRRDLSWIRRQDPGLDVFGQPEIYAVRGWFPVQMQPSNPSPIFVVSNDADTDTLHWEYLLMDGSRRSGTTVLTGMVAVQIGSTAFVTEITKATLATHNIATSQITIREDSGAGPILALFNPSELANRYLHIQLWPTPQSATTYFVDYTRELVDLVEDFEEPLLPPDFHHVLSLGAQADEWRRMDDDRYVNVRQDMEIELRNLNAWLWDLADSTDERREAGWTHSRLGPWFPRGT